MPLIILTMAIQVALIVHCIRTGRNSLWIWAIALLPMVGSIAYIVAEVLPSLSSSRGARRAVSAVRKTLDPDRDLRQYASRVRLSGDIDSRRRLAEEQLEKGLTLEAIATYRSALTGLYEHDPTLMLGLARAHFAAHEQRECRETLDELIEHNPDFKSPEGHLLYARALEEEGDAAKALEEYRVLSEYYPGAEARVRYALILKRSGNPDQARQVLREVLDSAELAPAHYRKAQQEWLERARRELSASG